MSETLKPLETALTPDERWGYFRVDFSHLYEIASELELPASVHPEVRQVFALAQNILIYSYFQFSMASAALLHAHSALEAALRHRLKTSPPRIDRQKNKGRGEPGLKALLDHALVEGWIEEGWDGMAETISSLRNSLAHGAFVIDIPGTVGVLRRCRDLIIQVSSTGTLGSEK